MKNVKKTTQQFKQEIDTKYTKEFSVLSEYVNSKTKIDIRHNKCNNIHSIAPINFDGTCLYCKRLEEVKTHYSKISELAKTMNFSVEPFPNIIGNIAKYKLTLVCNACKTKIISRYGYFLQKYKNVSCETCKKTKLTNTIYETFSSHLRVLDLEDQYEIVTKDIVSLYEPVEILHKTCGTIQTTTISKFINKKNKCKTCAVPYNKVLPEDFLLKFASYENSTQYNILNPLEYKTNQDNLKFIHKYYIDDDDNTVTCGFEFTMTPHNFQRGQRCPKCGKSRTRSAEERELYEFINSISTHEVIHSYHVKKETTNKIDFEIDIYIPALKIGFEYCGLYWHSDKFVEDTYHLNKLNKAKEHGIQLYQIFSDEWLTKKDIVKSKVSHIINHSLAKYKIYARHCTIREIDVQDKTNFLNKHHIQGADKSVLNLGMFFEDELVSVMTFSNLRKVLGQKSEVGAYELSRFASKLDYVVVGGFSKLFKYFTRNYEFSVIRTYADLRWSFGNLYLTNGFELIHQSKPAYSYITGSKNTRLHRFNFMKQRLKYLFPDIYDDNKTERQIMQEAGYHRVFTCGNLVFEYKNQNSH
jgi:hypothetical protein